MTDPNHIGGIMTPTIPPPDPDAGELKPVAWRWRWFRNGKFGDWRVTLMPMEPEDEVDGSPGVEVEPLYTRTPDTEGEVERAFKDGFVCGFDHHERTDDPLEAVAGAEHEWQCRAALQSNSNEGKR